MVRAGRHTFELKSMFRRAKKTPPMVKGTLNAGLPIVRPQQLGTQAFLCFSNIYLLILWDAAGDRKLDGVLLGPESASVHTYTPGQTEQRKSKQMGRFRCERHTCCPFCKLGYSDDNDGKPAAACWRSRMVFLSIFSVEWAGRLKLGSGEEQGDRLLTDRLYSLAGVWAILGLGPLPGGCDCIL